MKRLLKQAIYTLLIGIIPLVSNGVPKKFVPTVIHQPDGTKIECYASGDEFHNWLHDANGYTIIQHPQTGYYVYAQKIDGRLVPSDLIVGKDKPSASKGIEPYLNISRKEYLAKRKRFQVNNHYQLLNPAKGQKNGIAPLNSKAQTVMNNIVVFIQFADDNITDEPLSVYENIYNGAVSSVNDYYSSVSYDKFTVSSSFYPTPSNDLIVWFTGTHNRNYYRPYNATTNTEGYDPDMDDYTNEASKTYREHTLLKTAIDSIAKYVPSDLNIDINNDGYIDVVSFILAGENDGWNDLLWPHQWSLWSKKAYINGKQVGDYTLQLQYFGNNRIDLGTLCHEMFHAVGAPDLYHYDDNMNRSTVGIWDIMEGTRNEPQNMGAYMKYLYGGWIDEIPEITQTGTYTLNPLSTSATGNVYKIPSPNSYTEYFVVEYRKREAYDASLPGDGMLVYRINSVLEGKGNADGPPDEVYLYRPGGTLVVNGSINDATFNASYNRTQINDQTDPKSFLSNGTDGGLNISNVSAASTTISFNATIDFDPWVVLKNDNGYGTAIGNGSTTLTAATRFTTDDLTNVVGKYINKVDFYIKSDNGTRLTSNEIVKVWEGGTFGDPGTLIYEKNVSNEVRLDQWTSHQLDSSITIKPNKEYWVGYTATASSGYPFATDRGPYVVDKGGWLYDGSQWKQLSDYNLNYNFLIRAIVNGEKIATGINTSPSDNVNISAYPNPVTSETNVTISGLEQVGMVNVSIYNMLGQQIKEIVNSPVVQGQNTIKLDLADLSRGVYIVKVDLHNGGNTTILASKKIKITKF